jgi:hypothetical protein
MKPALNLELDRGVVYGYRVVIYVSHSIGKAAHHPCGSGANAGIVARPR